MPKPSQSVIIAFIIGAVIAINSLLVWDYFSFKSAVIQAFRVQEMRIVTLESRK